MSDLPSSEKDLFLRSFKPSIEHNSTSGGTDWTSSHAPWKLLQPPVLHPSNLRKAPSDGSIADRDYSSGLFCTLLLRADLNTNLLQ
jgi:hypothetical protein